MTAALASYVDDLDLPAQPGVSTRAVRAVLRMMAKIADNAGQFRYGLRGSKLATLTEYSLSGIRRAQRYLIGHGFLERIQLGGGRASTRWRVCVHKLRPDLQAGHSSTDHATRHPAPDDTAQERSPKLFHEMHGWSVTERPTTPPPLRNSASKTARCEHGDDPGRLVSGLPRCPLCRHYAQSL